jgi:hypothetical protein
MAEAESPRAGRADLRGRIKAPGHQGHGVGEVEVNDLRDRSNRGEGSDRADAQDRSRQAAFTNPHPEIATQEGRGITIGERQLDDVERAGNVGVNSWPKGATRLSPNPVGFSV